MKRGDASPGRGKRRYSNELREAQVRLTREKILEALEALLDEGTIDDLSVPAIAERSGVSVATIYRHFPNRESLITGITKWLEEKAGHPAAPLTLDDLAEGMPDRFRFFTTHADAIRLGKQLQSWKPIREYGQVERDREVTAVLAPLTDHLDPARARALHGVFRVLFGFDLYMVLADRFDTDGEAMSEAVGFVARAAIAELERQRQQGQNDG
jgi:AcrR family transcriptional regulator